MRYMAFDPGATTGVCELDPLNYEKIRSFNITSDDIQLFVWDTLNIVKPSTIIYERFDYRPYQKTADLTPVEVIGVIKLYAQEHLDITLVPQQQLKGDKGFWTDDKLKALDLYHSGEHGHSNDAVRQMLYYVTFTLGDRYFVNQLTD